MGNSHAGNPHGLLCELANANGLYGSSRNMVSSLAFQRLTRLWSILLAEFLYRVRLKMTQHEDHMPCFVVNFEIRSASI